MIKLSAVILAKNEEEMIGDCLASLSFCDEVIVGIDTSSVDKTQALAKRHGAKTLSIDMSKGFASAKNSLISEATNEWVLLLDADERVSSQLQKEIMKALSINQEKYSAYDIPFTTYTLGREMHYGGWQHEHHIRLFSKRSARYAEKEIHEQLQIDGSTGTLNGTIIHYAHRSISEIFRRLDSYSTLEAEILYRLHPGKIGAKQLFGPATKELWRRMIKERAYKDGTEGIIEAVVWSFYVFLNYAKAWELKKYKEVRK